MIKFPKFNNLENLKNVIIWKKSNTLSVQVIKKNKKIIHKVTE